MSEELKDTLNLPATPFPMRANLATREPARIAHWEKIRLYDRIQAKPAPNGTFVLHDGPPFTNGDVHIGTALNKLLKDLILRHKTMRGFRTPYVPGWDCHGLPIEHKVMKELQARKVPLSPLEIRQACAAFSDEHIRKQRRQFQRLGILADWDVPFGESAANPAARANSAEYQTKAPAYEASILRTFAKIVDLGLVYRSKKPVYWSIPCATALAEAEIEYKDKRSPSIWVAFPVPSKNFSVVIWTTTPWTLPANLAIAVHPDLDYVEIHHHDATTNVSRTYLVADVRADAFMADCALEGATRGAIHKGRALENLEARHPFIDRASPIVLADYVTTDAGTGCVHTAPGHGVEDYQTGLRCGLEIYCPVNDEGAYVDDGRVPRNLAGLSVLESADGKCPANIAVLQILREKGALLQLKTIQHQYPHCWRSKTPVIFRAVDQWFVALDGKIAMDGSGAPIPARQLALKQIGQVGWTPDFGENRIRSTVENRPDWCISRQRSWGIPIPAFRHNGQVLPLDAHFIKAIADKVAEHGTDYWFARSVEEIIGDLPEAVVRGMLARIPDGIGAEQDARHLAMHLQKATDTLDVWIDSGTSHIAVLQDRDRHPELHWPADLYLEGSDQHRGWFQSSLWTSILTRGEAPYRRVITHGFVVNEKRQKISKSDGKPQTADGYVNKYGADIVRLWVASENYQNDVPLSDSIFDAVSTQYRNLRNTLRYQLSNLYDFDPARHAVPTADLTLLDKWALAKLAELVREVSAACDAYEFHKAYAALTTFSANTLSATYHNILKDRLYTLAADAPARRSAQTAIHVLFETFVRLLAPFIPFTADEAWSYHRAGTEYADGASVHLEPWPAPQGAETPEAADLAAAASEFDRLLGILDTVNASLEALRQNKTIGQSLEAQVTLAVDPASDDHALLQRHAGILPETFMVSHVALVPAPAGAPLDVRVSPAPGVRCPRCWRNVEATVHTAHGDVCPRCAGALDARA
ncbi:MAG: isoleucine--tRNA ligase [Puniceicoccales bacterium]|jgi:isoleucyl-tRNA synthetase|nr:isoleucine--tRNA ligase [Puniceicoccales bacterium]